MGVTMSPPKKLQVPYQSMVLRIGRELNNSRTISSAQMVKVKTTVCGFFHQQIQEHPSMHDLSVKKCLIILLGIISIKKNETREENDA